MQLTILTIAYPYIPMSGNTVGGAEQIASAVERGVAAAGHRSLVIAHAGSQVAGRLFPTPGPDGLIDGATRSRIRAIHQANIDRALRTEHVDVIHMHVTIGSFFSRDILWTRCEFKAANYGGKRSE